MLLAIDRRIDRLIIWATVIEAAMSVVGWLASRVAGLETSEDSTHCALRVK